MSSSSADRGSPFVQGQGRPNDQGSPVGQGSPNDQGSPVRQGSPILQGSPVRQGSPFLQDSHNNQDSPVRQGSPLGQDRTDRISQANSNAEIPEPMPQQPNDSDEEINTYRTFRIHYSDIERLREHRRRLASAIDDTYLRLGRIQTAESRITEAIENDPLFYSEDSNSNNNNNMISSASEDSNESLPESNVKVKFDVIEEEERPAKIRKVTASDEDLDGETCPICLDVWGNAGKHRLVALKCGHLFGAECVERWLKAQPARDRSCPTCKTKAALKDIRCIYARRITAADNSEITRLQKLVDILQADKCRSELNLQSARIAQRALAEQLENLKKSIAMSQGNKHKLSWRISLEKNMEITKEGGCRVLAYNCRTYEIYASQKSANNLFPGYGIRKVSCVDYTLGQFIHLHSKPIRGICYSQPNDMLLSVGLEGIAKISERGIPKMSVNAGVPLWSCAWDIQKPQEFYLGGVGTTYQYDLRNLSTCLRTYTSSGDRSPVVSVWSTEYGPISSQLNSCWLWESKTFECHPKAFPVSGPCLGLGYDHELQKALVTMRPKGTDPSKLVICSFTPTVEGGADIVVDCVINGSARASVMAKSTFCKTPNTTWVAAHSESDSALHLHGLDGARSMSVPSSEPALDVCAIPWNDRFILASLSECRLRIFKGTPIV